MPNVFKPQKRVNVNRIRHINYTCSPERYITMERLAKEAEITLKELLRQMVDFALEHADRK